MTTEELRKLAKTCLEADILWWDADEITEFFDRGGATRYVAIDAAFIAAASPEVVMGLLDRIVELEAERDAYRDAPAMSLDMALMTERDALKAEVKRLKPVYIAALVWAHHVSPLDGERLAGIVRSAQKNKESGHD